MRNVHLSILKINRQCMKNIDLYKGVGLVWEVSYGGWWLSRCRHHQGTTGESRDSEPPPHAYIKRVRGSRTTLPVLVFSPFLRNEPRTPWGGLMGRATCLELTYINASALFGFQVGPKKDSYVEICICPFRVPSGTKKSR